MSFPLDDTTRMGFITSIRNQSEARVNEKVMRTTAELARSMCTAPTAAGIAGSRGRTLIWMTSTAMPLPRMLSESLMR